MASGTASGRPLAAEHRRRAIYASMAAAIATIRKFDEIGAAKATTVTRSLTQSSATRWAFDFSAELLFPGIIERVTYSVVSDSKAFFNHLARTPNGTRVVVETSEPVTATVVVTAAQAL